MKVIRRLFTTLPVTTVFVLSFGGFWLIAVFFSESVWALALFYLLALPYYVVSLVGMAVASAVGTAPSPWFGVALCLAVDLLVSLPVRRSSAGRP